MPRTPRTPNHLTPLLDYLEATGTTIAIYRINDTWTASAQLPDEVTARRSFGRTPAEAVDALRRLLDE